MNDFYIKNMNINNDIEVCNGEKIVIKIFIVNGR